MRGVERSFPSSWRWVKTEDVCEIQLGKMLSPAAKTNARPRRYLRNANVLWNKFDLSSLLEMDFSEEEERKFELRAGDVLVCEGGEPGRAAVWEGQISSCFYQKALVRLRPTQDQIDPYRSARLRHQGRESQREEHRGHADPGDAARSHRGEGPRSGGGDCGAA